MKITWHGHNCWHLDIDGTQILIDPFLDSSPVAKTKAQDIQADYVILSHGHEDHVADAAAVIKKNGSKLIAPFEVANWFTQKHGVTNATGTNPGGTVGLPCGSVKFVPAIHSSSLPDGSYGGVPTGLVFQCDAGRVYFACDTALYSDMQLIGRAGIDLVVVPIGDQFTMGVDDSIEAIRMIQPRAAAPCHYDTWPMIAQNASAWADRVTRETASRPIVFQVGQTLPLSEILATTQST